MTSIIELKKEYLKKKREIRKRLDEFRKKYEESPEDLFVEMCYCLCTPLSKAEKVYKVINQKNKSFLLKASKEDLANFLKGNCRFHNNKAKYIHESRKFISELKKISKNPVEAREYLVKNVKGLGMKEAGHFLRNIGYKGLVILDGHILNCLKEFGVLKTNKRPSTVKEYLEIEKKMKTFAKKIKISVDELDLLFWSMKTGKVLK